MRAIYFEQNGCEYIFVPEQEFANFVQVSIWLDESCLGIVECKSYPEFRWQKKEEARLIKQVSKWLLINK